MDAKNLLPTFAKLDGDPFTLRRVTAVPGRSSKRAKPTGLLKTYSLNFSSPWNPPDLTSPFWTRAEGTPGMARPPPEGVMEPLEPVSRVAEITASPRRNCGISGQFSPSRSCMGALHFLRQDLVADVVADGRSSR